MTFYDELVASGRDHERALVRVERSADRAAVTLDDPAIGDPASAPVRRRTRLAATPIALLALVLYAWMTAGTALGSAGTAHAQASSKKPKGFTVKAHSGSLTLIFSSEAWASIDSSTGSAVGTATTPIAPATSTAPASLTFPITRGSLNSMTGRGTVYAQGGLAIESHLNVAGIFSSSSSASAANPVVSLGSTSLLTMTSANFSPPSAPLFTLVLGHRKAAGNRHAVDLGPIPAVLTAPGAQFFGSSFHTGEQIGTVLIKIRD